MGLGRHSFINWGVVSTRRVDNLWTSILIPSQEIVCVLHFVAQTNHELYHTGMHYVFTADSTVCSILDLKGNVVLLSSQ